MKSKNLKQLALVIMAIAFLAFVYVTYKVIVIVDKTQVGTSEGTYTSYVTSSKQIYNKAHNLTKNCPSTDYSTLCQVQKLLDFTSTIPYQTSTFQKKSAQKTIQENFGDCDDKSNLLISMLHALDIEAYFVLVPKHIFVIVPLDDSRLAETKGLWVNGEKYYILETTAKGSNVGYPLKYRLDEISAIIEPFSNEKMEIESLEFKL